MFATLCGFVPVDPHYPERTRRLDIMRRVLDGSLPFVKIPSAIDAALTRHGAMAADDRAALHAADQAARTLVEEFV